MMNIIKVVKKMIEAEVIVCATPVYWYAMSAQMKVYFEHLFYQITIRKTKGRALKGNSCYLVSVGSDEDLPE
jgi:multimeric flavodoxin WrbA